MTLGGRAHQPPSPRARTYTSTRPSHPPPLVLPAHAAHPFLQVVDAVGTPQERGAAPPLGGQQLRFPFPSTCPLPQLLAPALAPPLSPHRPFSSTPSPSLRTTAPTRRTLPVTGRLPPVRRQDPPPTARVPRLDARAPCRSRFGGADHWGLGSRPPAVTGGSLSHPSPPPCTAACGCPPMGQQHLGTRHCGAWSAVPLPSWPRTPRPHQLCCAGPTGTPTRQGCTSCAVQAPQEPPHARAAPAVLCRPHRNRAAPLRARALAVQGHAGRMPPPLSWGSGGRKQGESGPHRSPNRWSLQPAPPSCLRLAQVGSPSPPQRGRAPG